jgi:GNAT superfamily N-acetyltransferase
MSSTSHGSSVRQSEALEIELSNRLQDQQSRGQSFSREPESGYRIQTSFLCLWAADKGLGVGSEVGSRSSGDTLTPPKTGGKEIVAAKTATETITYLEILWASSKVKIRAYGSGTLEVVRGKGRIVGKRQGTLRLEKRDKGWTGSSFASSVKTKEKYRGQGIATAMYDAVDWRTADGTVPGEVLTEAGRGLWEKRLAYRRERR